MHRTGKPIASLDTDALASLEHGEQRGSEAGEVGVDLGLGFQVGLGRQIGRADHLARPGYRAGAIAGAECFNAGG